VKKLVILWFILLSFSFSSEINRTLLAFYDSQKGDNEVLNPIHQNLEVILNYYGYIVDFADFASPPQDTEKYYGVIFWFDDNVVKDPVGTINQIVALKNAGKKILWIGSVPTSDGKNDYTDEINGILEKNFGFKLGAVWSNDSNDIKERSSVLGENFEKKFGFAYSGEFMQIVPTSKVTPLMETELVSEGLSYPSVFKSEWGVFAQDDKLIYRNFDDLDNPIKRWMVNPFLFVKEALPTEFPIPDVTTKEGRRVAYIHIDGDGALSKSEVIKGAYAADVYYQKIAKIYPFKTGVSFIVADLDKRFHGNDKIIKIAKEIYALPYIEAASHTYTHPLNWSEGVVAFSKNKNVNRAMYGGISAYKEQGGEVDKYFEIEESVQFIDKLLPKGKSCKSVYWSGDCLPTKKDIEYVQKEGLLAMNGGDSFFDNKYNSYSFLSPLTRDVNGSRQIYSSGANENLYTELWTDNFWGFAAVKETFKRSGEPIRIKPINLYYHFYSLEKIASYKALASVYEYLKKIEKELVFIYPSEYIDSVLGFFEARIYKEGSRYRIENSQNIREYRVEGRVELAEQSGVKSVHYDRAQDVTYITISGDEASFEVRNR